MQFPTLAPNVWRSPRPYLVTLTDGDRMPAYPVICKVEDGGIYFGEACKEPMWLVHDTYIESTLITECNTGRVIETKHVVAWEEIVPVNFDQAAV